MGKYQISWGLPSKERSLLTSESFMSQSIETDVLDTGGVQGGVPGAAQIFREVGARPTLASRSLGSRWKDKTGVCENNKKREMRV